jgi:exopolysaccharide biosynthesis polyprenyl glycosylphosphotransferase
MPELHEMSAVKKPSLNPSDGTSTLAATTSDSNDISHSVKTISSLEAMPSYLNLRMSERKLVLAMLDVALVNIALILALTLLGDFDLTLNSLLINAKWFVTLTVVWLACATFFDCYSLSRAASATHSVRNTMMAAFVTCLLYALIPYFTPPLTSRGVLFLFCGLTEIFELTWRAAYARIFVQPWFQQRALIVGAGTAGRALASAMQEAPRNDANPYRGTGYQIVGFVDDDFALQGQTISGVPVLGSNQALIQLAQSLRINEIILAITNTQIISDEMMNALLQCRELGLSVSTMAAVYERLTGRVPIGYVGRDLQMVLPMSDNAGERAYRIAKRGIDILFALLGLSVIGIVIIPIAIANQLTSPGPLFYTQKRVGQGGKLFKMYKFRSMRPDAERGIGAVWARQNDDRITPVGKFVRKTRLDELPQSINVLLGQMSVIGPRPERPEFVNALSLMIPYYRARHAVKPGITGWAQIKYGYGGTQNEAAIKLEHDLYYVKHASPLLDTLIILQTFPVMILGKGQ